MKKFIGLAIVLLIGVCGMLNIEIANEDYIRIHVKAHSNTTHDQNLKYEVRDEIMEYLTPKFGEIETEAESYEIVKNELSNIQKVANDYMHDVGYSYTAKVDLIEEYYPTRQYNGHVVESGNYNSLVVELGEGDGDNWWCVVYPPLCFMNGEKIDSDEVVYKSWIKEILS